MVPGDSCSEEDKQVLHQLFEGNKENLVELHEVWLKTEHRGKGYGNRFFEFFERFANKSGFDGIVYYSDNPSAISLCRKRRYKESLEPLEGAVWNIFVKLL
jgi:GNAT superfamily N-acetyltransferase